MGTRTRDWVILHGAKGIGDRRKRRLIEACGGPAEALRLTAREVAEALECPPGDAARFTGEREDPDRVLRGLERCGAFPLAWDDPRYPPLLRETYDPPLLLFTRGDLSLLERPATAIVGARRALPEAAEWTRGMASDLARSGFLVAIGFARWIDGAAHEGELEAGEVSSAVCGTGPDLFYPREHRRLGERIAAEGLVLTERPPGAKPRKDAFPRRNRILAGLAEATVVVQASEKSGARITARLALEAGREVFVLAAPPWDRRFAGNRILARDGAAVVQDGEEVALRLGAAPAPPPEPADRARDLRGTPGRVARALAGGPLDPGAIARAAELPGGEVLAALLRLELEGIVEERPGKVYAMKVRR